MMDARLRELRNSPAVGLCLAILAGACGDDATAVVDAGMAPTADGGSPSADAGTATDAGSAQGAACDASPELLRTELGVEFVRTPDSCFSNLPGWSYAPRYVEIDGLRQAYVDEGDPRGAVVLLLHGQPSWSYLYRKMIPVLAEAGFRVIAMDHLGMGRSDKPVEISAYSYLGHGDRLLRFIEALDLREINLFVQDWGSLIGLRVAGLHSERFARIAVGNGDLPVAPAGAQLFPPVESPDEIEDIPSVFETLPAQQIPFYDENCELLFPQDGGGGFGSWMRYAMKARSFRPSEVLEALTWFDLPSPEEAAYDAPFPSRIYMAGVRTFPSLINEIPGQNDEAWAGLMAFEKPFLTIWAANDPGNLGRCETQQNLIDAIPGAAGLPHARLPEASHFLQDDQGPAIAQRLAPFFSSVPLRRGSRYCELLLVKQVGGSLEAEVWGTQNLNNCPAEAWEAIDLEAVRAATGALSVVRNGPRIWLVDETMGSRPGGFETMMFGELRMVRLATVPVTEDSGMGSPPYSEIRVNRNTTYRFADGSEIFELTNPGGETYVMQSLSLVLDPSLSPETASNLGPRLNLPEGWSFAARTLSEDLMMMTSEGVAIITVDDLDNTYQRR